MSPARMDDRKASHARVVLTGGTGFIGRHLQHELLQSGHDVTVLVRPNSTNAEHVLPGAEIRRLELDDAGSLADALSTADFAVYAAGAVRGRCPADFQHANVAGAANFAAAAQQAMRHPRVVLISSLAATRPALSDYAASKRAGEEMLRRARGVDWVILRPPAVYGPGDRELRPLFAAMRRGLVLRVGPRGQRLALLHATDLARAVGAVIAHFDRCAGNCFELDDGHPLGYGWPELVRQVRQSGRARYIPLPRALLVTAARMNLFIATWLDRLPMLSPGKVRELSEPSWLCNNRPFVAATGWSPHIALHDGVAALFGAATHVTQSDRSGR